MTPADLLALAERCEQAAGADLDLDHAIHDLVGDNDGAPLYTRSLNAAMTLVPENYTVMLHFSGCGHFRPGVTLWLHGTVGGEGDIEAEAATPALALTAACLKARAATLGDGKC